MALEGTLRDFSLADIFQLIGIQKKTGVLTLKNADEVVSVSFLDGNVVSADSLNKNLEDRLGTVLVRSGRMTAEKLEEALKIQKETLQRLGYLLVHRGYIKEDDLREALRLQITQIVYRLFRWKDGEYHFSQEETVEYDRANFAPVSAENILMEGIRMIDEWPIIERKIHSFDMIFRKVNPGVRPTIVAEEDETDALENAISGAEAPRPGSVEGLRLLEEEAVVYELVDGKRTIQEIIDCSHMGEFETCRILYELLSRNLVVEITFPGAVAAASTVSRAAPVAGRALEWLGYAAFAAAIIVSVATMKNSPLSGMPGDLVPSGTVELIRDLVARNRIERLDEAVQVYYLQKGFYPDDLNALVKGRLVSEVTLRDPWGRSFGYVSTTEGYRIVSYDPGGVENPTRSIARGRLRLPTVKRPVTQELAADTAPATQDAASPAQ